MGTLPMRAVLMILAALAVLTPRAWSQDADVRDSVVKISVTYRAPDIFRPWSKAQPSEITGTGFVIDGQYIITNAHVAEHASRVYIQPPRTTDQLVCEVVALAKGIDLALLKIKDEDEATAFFAEHPPLRFRGELPEAGGRVEVYGFPGGGSQLSVTSGVVSRIEYGYYYDFTRGLTVQIDAAVNPGNSGGPALHDGEVIGVVFSRMNEAENVGFVIPTEEVTAFLEDVEDGTYEGRPRIFIGGQDLENDGLRDSLGLPDDVKGVLATVENTWLAGDIKVGDVITGIGDYDIDNTGTIEIRDDLRVSFAYAAPHLADDEGNVTLDIWRDGEATTASVPAPKAWPFVMPYLGSDYPPYVIYGPLVFIPAYADFLTPRNGFSMALRQSPIAMRAFDTPEFEGEQIVMVISPMFPHEITKGYAPLNAPTLASINGVKVKNLAHLVEILRDLDDEFVSFEWAERESPRIVFNRQEAVDATEEILENNGIRRQMSPELLDIWEADSD